MAGILGLRQPAVVAFTAEERAAVSDVLTVYDLELRSKRRFYATMGQPEQRERVNRQLLLVHLAQAKVGDPVSPVKDEEDSTS